MIPMLDILLPTKVGSRGVLAVTVGDPEAQVGDRVDVNDRPSRLKYESMFVAEVDTFLADDMPEGILDDLGIGSLREFIGELSKERGALLPNNVQVTSYLLTVDQPHTPVSEKSDDKTAPKVLSAD